jgi:hypothetical protein
MARGAGRGRSKLVLPTIRRRVKLLVVANPLTKLMSMLTPKRRWAQFRLRTLFVLVAIATVPCVWLSWRVQAKRRDREAISEIENLGGGVLYDWQRDRMTRLADFDDAENDAPGARWLRKLLGDDFFAAVSLVSVPVDIADAQLVHVEVLTGLNSLELHGPQLTDAGLEHLKGLKRLESLTLDNTGVTDAGLEHLKGLTRLESLRLNYTAVTDAGLEHVKELTSLKELMLCDTRVTDAGLAKLQGLTRLRALFVMNTSVTDGGVAGLQKALPDCNIWMAPGAQWGAK